jgi:hypothetical protein
MKVDRMKNVEKSDEEASVEVVAMYRGTVMDVLHVGHRCVSKWRSPAAIGAGTATGAAGIFILGPGAPGISALGLGMVSLVAGLVDREEKNTRGYRVGESPQAHFPLARPNGARDVLLVDERDDGEFFLNVGADMQGQVSDGRDVHDVHEFAARQGPVAPERMVALRLEKGVRCQVQCGDQTFHVRVVDRGPQFSQRGEVDRTFLAYLGGSAMTLGAALFVVLSVPQTPLTFDFADETIDPRFTAFLFQPNEVVETTPPPEERKPSESGGGTPGQAHAGEGGKMGSPKEKSQSGIYALRGPKHAVVQLARDLDPEQRARTSGILGVLADANGAFLASPTGAAFAQGNDDEDIWGGLTGHSVAAAYGVMGLGLVGTGRQGGGTGEGTIGLGNSGLIGTIGRGDHGGQGGQYGRDASAGFGARQAGRPVIRQAISKTIGKMDPSIIRRIVRAHENEVRSCYMQGLARNPSLSGRVAVQFVISGMGAVVTSTVQETSLRDRSVAQCVAQAVGRWRFPRPQDGGTSVVTYPFVFSVE